jgi:hypothetical protein
MKRILFVGLIVTFFIILSVFSNVKPAQAAAVTLSTSVQSYLDFSLTAGTTVAFGSLTPATPIAGPATGTVASVTTNAGNGYTIGVSDGSDTNSALVHTDASTYIADYAGTITTPTSWTSTGLGITLYAADTSKEAKWGTGTTYNDSNNKYAGIPSAATTSHTVTGYHSGADTSSWAFKIDVPNTQKTGSYSGSATFTATAVLS